MVLVMTWNALLEPGPKYLKDCFLPYVLVVATVIRQPFVDYPATSGGLFGIIQRLGRFHHGFGSVELAP